ncbi:hypothetical protein Tco_0655535 [Tanacetum coccineum]|uniref:Uncharacterized protein n=1 Tax=Tanacetum coccineum TaxID=301880 RepID=A0ABQ4X7D4_9ASTR
MLPRDYHKFLLWGTCNKAAMTRYNTKLAHLLMKQIYSSCIVDWRVLNKISCAEEIENMLEIKVYEAGSREEIFNSEAYRRVFDINEPIYTELCHEFYSTYDFDEIAKRLGILTNEVLDGLSAPTYFQALDVFTLKELTSPNERLIFEDPSPGVPHVAIPRGPRPYMELITHLDMINSSISSSRMMRSSVEMTRLDFVTVYNTYHSYSIEEDMADKKTESTMKEFSTNDQEDYYSGITWRKNANSSFDDEASNHEDASDTGAAPKQQQQMFGRNIRNFIEWMGCKRNLEAIRTRFIGVRISTEDANHKFLRSLPAWSNLAMTMRTKPDVDTLSIDDLYNNLRVFDAYSTCTPSTSSTNIPEKEALAGFADEIDDLDIEEMDINWQIAMIAIRMKKFYKKTGRRVRVDGKHLLGTHDRKKKIDSFYQHQEVGKQEKNQMGLLTMDDGIVNWGEHTKDEETNHALMAISSSSEVFLCSKTCIDSYNTLKTLCDEQMNQLGNQEAQILAYSQAVKKLEAQLVTFQKHQLSLNEKLTFQANEIYEKDEKLKKYRENGNDAVKDKEQFAENINSWKDSSRIFGE